MRKKKGILIVLLLFISVGFAYLSTNLYINGTSLVKSNTWKVYFDNITESSNILINKNATISSDKKSVDFEFTFEKPGDEYHFYVDVVNDGTLDAMLDLYEVTGLTTEQDKYIDWTVTYADETNLNKYDLLKSKNKDTLLVKVKYIEDVNYDDLPKNSDIAISLKFKAVYVQADSNFQVERNRTQYKIKYNLDGGTISNNPTTYYQGDRVVIPNPTKEGYTFAGWTVGKNLLEMKNHTLEKNGITFTVNEDKSITMNGIATADTFYGLNTNYNDFVDMALDIDVSTEYNYVFNGKPFSIGNRGYLIEVYTTNEMYYKGNFNVTSDASLNAYIKISTGAKIENETVYPYLNYIEKDQPLERWCTTYSCNAGYFAEYEPYISTPTKDIVIPVGASGNRTYVANWISN